MSLSISDICILFARKGGRAYDGEPVTQLEHALQAATRAEQSGASAAIVTAALLHDLGHLLNDQGETPTLRGVDDVHQYAALPFLRGLFGDDVLSPIKLHVDAKRYLCATRSEYYDALSVDSKRSLALQGIDEPEEVRLRVGALGQELDVVQQEQPHRLEPLAEGGGLAPVHRRLPAVHVVLGGAILGHDGRVDLPGGDT